MLKIASEEQGPLVRVLVGNVSPAIAQWLVPLIQKQPDMMVVGQVRDNVELLLAASADIDVVILGASRVQPPPGICSHLLSEFPTLKILVLARPDEPGMLYWLGLRHRRMNPLSATTLVSTIRRTRARNSTV